jgi:hypothetical protein
MVSITKAATHARMHAAAAAASKAVAAEATCMPCSTHAGFEAAACYGLCSMHTGFEAAACPCSCHARMMAAAADAVAKLATKFSV